MANLRDIHSESYSDMPFDDFAQRYHQKFYSDMPFDEFATKAGISKPTPAAPAVSVGEDIGKSALSGLAKGAAGAVGMVPNISNILRSGFNAGLDKLGVLTNGATEAPKREAFGLDLDKLGTSAQVQQGIESVTGKLHEPQTRAGKFAHAAAEFVPMSVAMPGGVVRNAVSGVAAGLGSEAAGQATAGTRAEPYARFAGGVLGSFAPSALSRVVTPLPATNPERMAAVRALEAEGVPLTAGQATGSRPLQYMESVLGDVPGAGGKAAAKMLEQQRAFTAAAMKRGGGATADAPGMAKAFAQVGQKFDDLAASTTAQVDRQLAQEIGQIAQNYVHLTPPNTRVPLFSNIVDSIIDVGRSNGGAIAGEQYKSWRSQLARAMRGSADPEFKQAAGGLIEALDGMMMRSAGPAGAKAWQEARSQYKNLLALERAATAAGENAAQGFISPSSLRNAVVNQGRRNYAQGKGDLAELARAGEAVMKPLPNSGTAPRAFAQGLLSGGGFMAGGLTGGAAGLLGPAVAGRALMSAPVQAYLKNQAVPRMQSQFGLLAAPENQLLNGLLLSGAITLH